LTKISCLVNSAFVEGDSQSINQSINSFVPRDINSNTVTIEHSSEQDRQGTESALTVALENIYISESIQY